MNEDAARRGATRRWRRVRSRGRSPVDSGIVLCRNAADKIISFQGSPREWRSGSALGIACIEIAKKLRSIHLSTNALWTRRTTQFPFQPQKLRLFHLELDGLIFITSYAMTFGDILRVTVRKRGEGFYYSCPPGTGDLSKKRRWKWSTYDKETRYLWSQIVKNRFSIE